ncbi:molybdopterin biosynthesis protein [Thiohalorhabdus methylotrophus]|uniref:Molybdopterin molybdenumtransferase n=1 Tax=Thiohalorhabdus methylotrophus TaxID=3242694 RepID=A0ABV4TYJ6_9GAMM
MTNSSSSPNQRGTSQGQFLEVMDRNEAEARFLAHLQPEPLGIETLPLAEALERVLAEPVAAELDVPGFDRANVDGFAVRADDTFGAMEESSVQLRLNAETLEPGMVPEVAVTPGTATPVATGAILPRGADAVVLVERTELLPGGEGTLEVRTSVAPGQNVAFAGTDIGLGETVLRRGQLLTSREIGVLGALGRAEVTVYRRPRVAVLSTGNEVVPQGEPLPLGSVYDANGALLTAAVQELGGEPTFMGVIPDDEEALAEALSKALEYDVVVLSGGTSKGAGDLSYRVAERLDPPGIIAHGVALKPGKPICLAASGPKPVVVLPGFPTSAIFTFHEFLAPVIRSYAGRGPQERDTVTARLPLRVNSERGRQEYLLVSLVQGTEVLSAYPMGKGSGSVTAFTYADGFIAIPRHTELLDAGTEVIVQLMGEQLAPADLVAIGSHCVGLDVLLGELQGRGISTKALHVGSMGGLAAARRGECDIAGVHLLDPESGTYNRPFLDEDLELVPGYRRMQGIVFRAGDRRFTGKDAEQAVADVAEDPECAMVNRNPGSGTRILTDRLLAGREPAGYGVQTKSHNAVAAAVAQGRADWGVAIETVATDYGLGFLPMQEEHYDFVVPRTRLDREPVRQFRALLDEPEIRERLQALGFRPRE